MRTARWTPVLVAVWMAAAAEGRAAGAAPSAPEEIEKLRREYEGAVAAFMEEYRRAPEAGQKAMLADPAREPRHRFAPRFRMGADRHRGSEAAIPYLLWLVQDGAVVDRKLADLAVERLLTEHAGSPALVSAPAKIRWARGLRGVEQTEKDLTAVLGQAPQAEVRAEALLHRGLLRLAAGEPKAGEAAADLERARDLAPGTETAKRAEKELQALDRGRQGHPAPPLKGPGLDGSTFQLDRLRGQVVLVDFWGMWCGPCVGALPELQRLEKRFAGRPFTIVGVNSDPSPEKLRQFLAGRGIRWPQVLDGAIEGPNAVAWGVVSWPASFLIDGSGRVRGRDLAGEARDRAIEELLREAEGKGREAQGGSRRGL